MELDTSIPPWLQRNLAPREPFDVTPWLQERYRRQVEQQKLPLQLQQMALQNEASRLGVEHQGIVNEMQGTQMMAYKDELPRFQQILNDTAGDPVKIMDRVESFNSPVLQKQWLDLRQSAAATTLGMAHREQIINDMKQAASLTEKGFPVAVRPDGTVDRDSLTKASQDFRTYNEQLMNQRYGYHYLQNQVGEGNIGDAVPVKAQDTGEVIGHYVQGAHGPRFQPLPHSSATTNFRLRQRIESEIQGAEDTEDYEKADQLRADLRRFDATVPGFGAAKKMADADRMAVQSLYHRIGQINAQITKLADTTDETQAGQKLALSFEAAKLQRQINAIVKKYEANPSPAATSPALPPATTQPAPSAPGIPVYDPVKRALVKPQP